MTDHLKTIRELLPPVSLGSVAAYIAVKAALDALEQAMREPMRLDHIACIEDGELRYMTGRKAPAHDCELYAMPDGKSAPPLFAVPPAQQAQRPDFHDEWTGYLKDGETPFERFRRERKDLDALMKLYQRALEENERLKAQQAQAEAVPTVCNHTYVLDHRSSIEVCQHCGAPKRNKPEDNWQQYAKKDENAQQCIERHRKEQDALLELLRQAKQQAEAVPGHTLPYERALAELIEKIAPGLDSGDVLADAATASAAITPQQAEAVPSDAVRMDWIAMHGSFGVDSVTGLPGGNGQKRIAATRAAIDAAMAQGEKP